MPSVPGITRARQRRTPCGPGSGDPRAAPGPALGAPGVLPLGRADRAAQAVASHSPPVGLVRARRRSAARTVALGPGRHDPALLGVAAHGPGAGPARAAPGRLRRPRAGAAGLPAVGGGG